MSAPRSEPVSRLHLWDTTRMNYFEPHPAHGWHGTRRKDSECPSRHWELTLVLAVGNVALPGQSFAYTHFSKSSLSKLARQYPERDFNVLDDTGPAQSAPSGHALHTNSSTFSTRVCRVFFTSTILSRRPLPRGTAPFANVARGRRNAHPEEKRAQSWIPFLFSLWQACLQRFLLLD